YHHKATVEADPSEDSGTEEEFVFQVACLAGYHPAGYDMLFPRVKEVGGGIYQVEWESAKHSDREVIANDQIGTTVPGSESPNGIGTRPRAADGGEPIHEDARRNGRTV